MSTHKTEVLCAVCAKEIVANVTTETNGWIGSGRTSYTVSFHCSGCMIVYIHPPGKLEAASEIIKAIKWEKDRPERERREAAAKRIREGLDLTPEFDKGKKFVAEAEAATARKSDPELR